MIDELQYWFKQTFLKVYALKPSVTQQTGLDKHPTIHLQTSEKPYK